MKNVGQLNFDWYEDPKYIDKKAQELKNIKAQNKKNFLEWKFKNKKVNNMNTNDIKPWEQEW